MDAMESPQKGHLMVGAMPGVHPQIEQQEGDDGADRWVARDHVAEPDAVLSGEAG
jgi:hypothetical protein